ncbi:MFS transporter [Ktedonospora formicarum]|uniref:Tetracycline resistance MFS efflux pump n=1 Tax=Ktedonospora formicarum TaxID=2778364 RepID=A0A8J3IES8_9CHLR|nr:MFS transporter [Ktedonospora formicarum]GHO50629.1 tetracycline resistance MFS efflux pump [Ktedonospora formicarum]
MAIIPIIPVVVLGQFSATPFQAALVIATYYVAQVLAAPWLGSLADRFGRRPILLLSQVGTIGSYLLLIFATPLGALLAHAGLRLGIAPGLAVIYLARVLDGLTGGNVSVAGAYASDISTPEKRTQALGLVGGASGLGHILGPALAGLLAGVDLFAPFVAAAVVSGVTVLLTLILLSEPSIRAQIPDTQAQSAEEVTLSRVLLSRSVVLILATALLVGLYMAGLSGTFALYADRVLLPGQPEGVVVSTVGWIITVLGLVMALTQLVLLNPLAGHLGERKAIVLGCVLLLVSAVGLFTVTSLWVVIACVVIFSLGYGIVWPTLQALITRAGPERLSGRLLGWFQATFSLALILGPIVGGFAFDTIAPRAVYMGSIGVMALALVLSIGLQRLPLRDVEKSQQTIRFHH